MKINYIILQYNLYEKTIECVKSIKNNTNVDYRIIIVDNCSTNNAYDKINSIFQNDLYVTVIQTNQNLGFDNGNNYGINYAKTYYEFDWIIVMNNDIYLNSKINENLFDSNYRVIGPDIYRLDTKEHQNPLPGINYSNFYISLMIFIYHIYMLLNTLYLDSYLHKLAIKALDFINKRKIKNQKLDLKGKNVVSKIHGSVIFFKKDFIEEFPEPFHPSTFMYLEEDFLALRCKRSNIEILYDSSFLFCHDHSSTVDSISKNSHERSRYVYQHNIKSLKSFKKYYNGEQA